MNPICELCWHRYNLGISWNTLVWEYGEYELCNYCNKEFNEIEFRKEIYNEHILFSSI